MNIEQKPSPNHSPLSEKAYIVFLHTTLGSYEGAIQHLTKAGNPSAHFVVGRVGQIAQLVKLDRGAWHAGAVSRPSQRAKNVCRYKWGRIQNPNWYSIGIENAAGWDIDRDGVLESWEKLFSPKMIKATAELILHIERETGILIPNDHILTHKDVTSYKPDLEIQRSMVISVLDTLRGVNPPAPIQPVEDQAHIRDEIIRLANKIHVGG